MKQRKFFLSIVFFLGAATSILAQTVDTLPYKLYEIGPLVTGGISAFTGSVPQGSKTDVQRAFTVGALGAYAFNRQVGATLCLGFESRGIFFKKHDATEPNETIELNYFTVQPSIRFNSFLLGFNLGIPISSSFESKGSSYPSNPNSFSLDSMNLLFDVRAEGLLPILENDFGNLYLVIQASYPLGNAVSSNFYTVAQDNPSSTTAVTKSPVPSVQLGLTYLFSPGEKVK
jgi:hypothetical protein